MMKWGGSRIITTRRGEGVITRKRPHHKSGLDSTRTKERADDTDDDQSVSASQTPQMPESYTSPRSPVDGTQEDVGAGITVDDQPVDGPPASRMPPVPPSPVSRVPAADTGPISPGSSTSTNNITGTMNRPLPVAAPQMSGPDIDPESTGSSIHANISASSTDHNQLPPVHQAPHILGPDIKDTSLDPPTNHGPVRSVASPVDPIRSTPPQSPGDCDPHPRVYVRHQDSGSPYAGGSKLFPPDSRPASLAGLHLPNSSLDSQHYDADSIDDKPPSKVDLTHDLDPNTCSPKRVRFEGDPSKTGSSEDSDYRNGNPKGSRSEYRQSEDSDSEDSDNETENSEYSVKNQKGSIPRTSRQSDRTIHDFSKIKYESLLKDGVVNGDGKMVLQLRILRLSKDGAGTRYKSLPEFVRTWVKRRLI